LLATLIVQGTLLSDCGSDDEEEQTEAFTEVEVTAPATSLWKTRCGWRATPSPATLILTFEFRLDGAPPPEPYEDA